MYLHIKPEKIVEAKKYITTHLQSKAKVYTKEELLNNGLFGSNPSDNLIKRLGDIIILPFSKESILWYEKGVFEQNYYGHHGGLTPEEVDIPLLLLPM
jgi:hypothetical protein